MPTTKTEVRPDTRAERYDLMRREGLTQIRDSIRLHGEANDQAKLDHIEGQLAKLGGEYYDRS